LYYFSHKLRAIIEEDLPKISWRWEVLPAKQIESCTKDVSQFDAFQTEIPHSTFK